MAEIRLDDVAYPLVDAEDAWRVVSQSEVLTDLWDEWVEMGHPRRFRGGYYFGGGFDPTSGVLRLAPFYHAFNNNQLSTGYGYGFEAKGPSQSATLDLGNASTGTGVFPSLSWEHTVATGDNRILIVAVTFEYGATNIIGPISVTYDGEALTYLHHARMETGGNADDGFSAVLYYMVNPPVGAADVAIAGGATAYSIAAGAFVYTGVDTADPWRTALGAKGTGTTASITVASVTGDVVIDTVATGRAVSEGAITVTDDVPDEIWNDARIPFGNTLARGASSEEAGAATVTASWTVSVSEGWAVLAASLKPLSNTQFVYWADGDKIFKYTCDSTEGLTEVVAESGTADSATASTLVDAAPAWTDDLYNNNLIEITGGTGVGQRRRITDTIDATDTIDIAPDWDTTPDATSTYSIYASVYVASGAAGRPLYANGKWYVPMGASANVRRLDTVGATLDTWADAGFLALHMSTYQVGPQAGFARAHSVNKVDICYDTGNLTDWTGDDFPVGDTSTAITDLNEISGELIVNKTDVAYQFDSEGTSRPIGTFKNRAYTDADNGRGTKVWLDRAFIPSNQGLDRYVIGERLMGVGINRILGFRDVPGITSPRSRRHAYVEAVGHSIYVQCNGGELTGLMHARHREAGDPMGGELVWNHVLEIPLSKGMYVDSQNNLWIKGASTAEADRDIRVIELDDNGGLQKALRRGQASSEHEIWFDETYFRYLDETKQFASLMIETSNWATGASLQATIYRDDGSVEDVGSAITSATLTELTWTVGTSDEGRRGRLRLVLTTDGTYAPLTSDPIILHVTAKARTPTIYEGTIDASPEALGGHTYDAAEALKMLRRLVSAGFKNVGEPDVEAVFTGEVVAVREKMVQRGDGQEVYEIPVLVRRWVIA